MLRLVPESDVGSLVLMEDMCSSVVYQNVDSLVSMYIGSSVSKDDVCSIVGSCVYKDRCSSIFEDLCSGVPEDVGNILAEKVGPDI